MSKGQEDEVVEKIYKSEISPVQLSVDKVLWEDGGIATVIFVRFNKKRKADARIFSLVGTVLNFIGLVAAIMILDC